MAGGNRSIENLLVKHWAFLLVFTLAAVLRFWNLSEADFSHDELSALLRTRFDGLGELFQKAIKVDGHPALVQLFLYYWAPLFNYQEFWIKLPSVLLGLGSIVLVYRISTLFHNGDKGELFPVIFMSFSELFIYHHQVARPYAYGAFFVSLAAYGYFAWFYKSKQNKYLIIFGIGAALAAYTHYLALLSVLLMGLTALGRSWRNPKPWLLTGLAVLAIFGPYLPMFWYQLNLGGVGQWLGPPKADWLFHFFHYLLNYLSDSPWFIGFSGILVGILIVFYLKFWEGWLWFIACFAIAFAYSILVNPVLQYSSLIFLSPFIFIFGKRSQKASVKDEIITLIFITPVLVYQLSAKRFYFDFAQESPAKEAGRYLSFFNRNIPVYTHWDPEKWDFYQEVNSTVPEGIPLEKLDLEGFTADEFLLILDHMSPAYWPLALADAGYTIVDRSNHFGFSLIRFSKIKPNARPRFDQYLLLDSKPFYLEGQQYHSISDSLELKSPKNHQQIVLRLDSLKLEKPAHLIFQLMEDDQQKAWYAHPIDSNTRYISQVIRKNEIDKRWKILIDAGPEEQVISGQMNARLWSGNRIIFGLIEDF